MQIPLDVVRSFIYENFEHVSVSKNGTHFHARCVLCGDSKVSKSKKRFHLDYNNGDIRYNCFNCNQSGSFIKLYSIVTGCSIEETKRKFTRFDSDYIAQALKKSNKHVKTDNQSTLEQHDDILYDCIDENKVPDGIIESQYINALKNFISNRNINGNQVYIAHRGVYQGRVIIPIIQDNHVIYFQARTLTGEEPKYINPVSKKESIILNRNKFSRNKHIIVTEGILDAWSVDYNQGTSCLGATISDEFLGTILTLSDCQPIIAMDNDARGLQEIVKIINKSAYSHQLLYFLMPDRYKYIKDLSELKSTVDSIYGFVLGHSTNKFDTSIKLKLRRLI